MGYGPVTPGGKQLPITPWKGSWAQCEEERRANPNPPPLTHNLQWPLGMNPKGVYVETTWRPK